MVTTGLLIRLCLGLTLVASGGAKAASYRQFPAVVAGYRLIPAPLVAATGSLVIISELAFGGLLLAGTAVRIVASMSAVLLAILGAATAVALRRRLKINCGCFGAGSHGEMSWRVVVRAGVCCGAAIFSAAEPGTHEGDYVAMLLSAALIVLMISLVGVGNAVRRQTTALTRSIRTSP